MSVGEVKLISKPKRLPGRPSRGERHTFGVRLTEAELEGMEAKRQAHGLTRAELIRRAVAAYPDAPAVAERMVETGLTRRRREIECPLCCGRGFTADTITHGERCPAVLLKKAGTMTDP